MLGSIIGAGVGAAASVFGGISASKAIRKMKANLEEQRKKNQDWYDQRYNEDATQRADAQRILTKTEEAFRNRGCRDGWDGGKRGFDESGELTGLGRRHKSDCC